jgi:16S rRNA (cytidine1402-2'-O)-methyltransferase
MIFYEAPHKLIASLTDMLVAFGDRRICLARELTKLHEEIVRTTLSDALRRYEETAPRGEFVVVVEGAAPPSAVPSTPEDAAALARLFLAEGLSASDAAKKAAAETGVKKGDIYRLLMKEN